MTEHGPSPVAPPIVPVLPISIRPRLEPPPPGLLLSAAMWGFATGVVNMLLIVGVLLLPSATWMSLAILPLIVAPFVLAVAVLAWGLVCPTWRARWIALAAILFGVGYGAANWASFLLQTPPTGPLAVMVWNFLDTSVAMAAVAAVLVSATWLVTYGVKRSRYTGALRHQPWRCYGCGYNLAGIDPDHACPECGRERGQHPGPARWAIFTERLRWGLLLMALALVVAGPVIYMGRWSRETLPVMRSLGSLGSTEFADLPAPGWGDNPERLAGHGVVIRFNDGSSRALYVVLPEGKIAGLPRVRIWLTEMLPMGNSKPHAFARRLEPPVICDLDPEQAESLFAGGLPPSLVEAMKAAGAGSQPTETWISTEDLKALAPTAIRIDPALHLPPR